MAETAEKLMVLAADAGYDITRKQLARWHRKGLLPKPDIQPLGRGKGTRSNYPVGTGNQLLALCAIHVQPRNIPRRSRKPKPKNFSEIGWQLWWRGFSVDEKYWKNGLLKHAKFLDSAKRLLINHFHQPEISGDDLSEQGYETLDALQNDDKIVAKGRNSQFRQIHKRTGNSLFASFIKFGLQILAGRYNGTAPQPFDRQEFDKDWDILLLGLGLHKSTKIRYPGINGLSNEDIKKEISQISDLLSKNSWHGIITASTDEEFRQTRNEAARLYQIAVDSGGFLEFIFGKYAFCLGAFARLIGRKSQGQQLLMLILFLLKQDAEKSQEIIVFLNTPNIMENAAAMKMAYDVIQVLRAKYPNKQDLFSPQRTKRALHNPDEKAKLLADIRKYSELK